MIYRFHTAVSHSFSLIFLHSFVFFPMISLILFFYRRKYFTEEKGSAQFQKERKKKKKKEEKMSSKTLTLFVPYELLVMRLSVRLNS